MDTPTITFLIAIIGCLIGIFSFYYGRKDNTERSARSDAIVNNELSHISNDVKDIKAEFRTFRSDITDVKTLAIQAKASADSAHDRLDSLEVASSYMLKRNKKKETPEQ